MSAPTLTCRDDARRHEVRRAGLNGLDYLEVGTDQLTLTVYFLGKAPKGLRRENFRVDGGERIRDIRVDDLEIHRDRDPELDDHAVITVDRWGDFSTYTLRVVDLDRGRPTDRPMPGFDPRYDRLAFSFKVDCPSDLDCRTEETCPPPSRPVPEINYLAKDYASFRQLMLDRLAVVMPEWRERRAADLGIALVEVLAYVGDHLSYFQDAVATEAYLDTARQRISVGRHARLMDYSMHEGVNARAWLVLELGAGTQTLPPEGFPVGEFEFHFVTGWDNMPPPGSILTEDDLPQNRPYEIFEPVVDYWRNPIRLCAANDCIEIYAWGDRQCCLPRGATRATLLDPGVPTGGGETEQQPYEQKPEVDGEPNAGADPDGGVAPEDDRPEEQVYDEEPNADDAQACDEDVVAAATPQHALCLARGDVVIFEEVKGPETGVAADADPARRHAVRLTAVKPSVDPLNGNLVVQIEWAVEDALPFPLCISSVGRAPECELIEGVSVARGNVVLVDHGRRIEDERLDPVPETERRYDCESECRPTELEPVYPRYRPKLERKPILFAEPYDAARPACKSLDQDPRMARPLVDLVSDVAWSPRADLLGSEQDDPHFVVEIDNEGCGQLRFGDGELGRRPPSGAEFRATYRVGYGPDGNVGAEAISHMVLRTGKLEGVSITARNPLPARGGVAPEPLADVRRLAPHAWTRELQRAITAEDYARIAERHPAVDRAAARLRWSGCSYKVELGVDPRGRTEAAPELLAEVEALLGPYRRMGHELLVEAAQYVALDIELLVCVLPDYQQAHVASALLEVLSNRTLADGSKGFFHPDRLSFGEAIHLSALVAAAQRVTGVESVQVRKLQRLYELPNEEIERGVLELGSFEVARLDNDPNFPENGRLKLDLGGGR